MTEKIEQQERKAIAAAELQEEFSGDALMQQFQALEYKGSTDQQLLELKAKMGLHRPGGGPAKQLGKGDTVDAELVDDDEGDKNVRRGTGTGTGNGVDGATPFLFVMVPSPRLLTLGLSTVHAVPVPVPRSPFHRRPCTAPAS